MIFCFVRETKQLTLEELDRKQLPILLIQRPRYKANGAHRGLFSSNKEVHSLRIDCVASMVYQAIRFHAEDSSPSTYYREGRER